MSDPNPRGPSRSDGATPGPARRRPGPREWRAAFLAWPRWLRATSYAGLALLLVVVGLAVTGVVVARRPLPQTTGTVDLAGLDADVEVVRDEHGIPQLYGDSLEDLMRAQGYVHAQERFFEMDLRRHITAGRLSEWFGARALETDKTIRTLGWRRVAEQELALISPETRDALQAYADGVNAYLRDHDPSRIALQYTLLRASGLRYSPADWTPVDSLSWLKAMAWDLESSAWFERFRSLSSLNHTGAQVDQILGPYPFAEHQPILPSGTVVEGRFEQESGVASGAARPAYAVSPAARRALARVQAALRTVPASVGHGDGLGSNSWVVSGDHTTTGEPILANDPHLGVSLPGIWTQMGLHCRTVTEDCPLDVAGFTFSGFPGVIIGHNADIAWGFTNLGPDVADYYLERVSGDRWRYAGRLRPMRIRHERIVVRGGEDFDLKVRETDHGPLLSDVSTELSTIGANADAARGDAAGDKGEGMAVALAWTGLRPSTTADAVLELDAARNWADFRAAARDFAVPAQNMVYADTDGHIGYQTPGLIPIRRPGNDGRLPARGWRRDHDWTGRFVPFEALPSELDPPEGVIVTANQAPVGPGYPYRLGDVWDMGYRSQRLHDRLTELLAEGPVSVQDLAQLQNDDLNPMAPTLVPYLLDVDLDTRYYRSGQDLLRGWDFHQPADSGAAAYYNAVWSNLLRLTFHDELRESLWPDGGDLWFAAVSGLLRTPADPWWDDRTTPEVRETRDMILAEAMRDARDELTRHQSLDPRQWAWGRAHRLDLVEPTLGDSGIGLVERVFDRRGYRVGGGTSIVDATAWDATQGYAVTSAPSMRMVVSLADFDDSRWIALTGVSGHPASAHYVDQTELWVQGRTLPWAFTDRAVHAAGRDVLTLRPAAE